MTTVRLSTRSRETNCTDRNLHIIGASVRRLAPLHRARGKSTYVAHIGRNHGRSPMYLTHCNRVQMPYMLSRGKNLGYFKICFQGKEKRGGENIATSPTSRYKASKHAHKHRDTANTRQQATHALHTITRINSIRYDERKRHRRTPAETQLLAVLDQNTAAGSSSPALSSPLS